MKIFKYNTYTLTALLLAFIVVATGCDEFDLPEAGSITDLTPPQAGFSYSASPDDFKTLKFTNTSSSATEYVWDFGDASSTDNTSTLAEPFHTYPGEGKFEVTLIVNDNLGVTSSFVYEVEVVEGPFQPVIMESGFEDGELADGTGDGRDSWRNSDLGGVIQITSSPVRTGSQAAKLSGVQTDQRIGYQLITVEEDTNYDLSFYYTMNNDQNGYITVSVLSGPVASHQEALDATIGSITVNDQTDPDTYVSSKVTFNSGSSTQVAIYFFNGGSVESRLDDFTITISQDGVVPPSSAFSFEQDDENYLAYQFTNGSLNASAYEWDFGDGNTSSEVSPSHVYAAASVYTVVLTATNELGTSATYSSMIDVQQAVYAGFEYTVDVDNYQSYTFADTSINVVSRVWDFGDGFLSTLESPVHVYAADGEYTVTLTATSITGATDVTTQKLLVAQGFVPVILESGFEDGQLDGGTGDGRDSWKVSGGDRPDGMGGTIQITSSPVKSGSQAAKFPSDNTRAAYQEIAVEAGKDYTVSFWYTLKDSPAGSLTVAILDGPVDDPSNLAAATIQSTTVSDQSDPDTYVEASVTFNSGSSETVVIYITNTDVEARVDDVTIQEI